MQQSSVEQCFHHAAIQQAVGRNIADIQELWRKHDANDERIDRMEVQIHKTVNKLLVAVIANLALFIMQLGLMIYK